MKKTQKNPKNPKKFLDNFYPNTTIEVYHPKVTYLIHKYKEYIIMIYQKVKEFLVKDIKIEKKI